jgi:hypothetical protein
LDEVEVTASKNDDGYWGDSGDSGSSDDDYDSSGNSEKTNSYKPVNYNVVADNVYVVNGVIYATLPEVKVTATRKDKYRDDGESGDGSDGILQNINSYIGKFATVIVGDIQYTLDHFAGKSYQVDGYINKAGYIRLLPKTEILKDVHLYKGLGKAATGIGVASYVLTIGNIIADKNLTPVQKLEKFEMETASVGVEFGAGLGIGALASISGPGAFAFWFVATTAASFMMDKGKNWLYEQLGL